MFEVVAKLTTGSTETYDALTEIQAECIFFRLRMRKDADNVAIYEVCDEN
jgi:hypothetical protein